MSGREVLIVAAHPDDEVLGCGGTIARHVDEGDHVRAMFLTDGEGARPQSGARDVLRRRDAAAMASRCLGMSPPHFGVFPDNCMDSVPLLDIVQAVEAMIRETRPTVLYTHHAGDLNLDHRRVHEAVMTACRPQAGHPVELLYAFEVPSSTEWASPQLGPPFVPTRYVDIARWLGRKNDALGAYEAELRTPPHPRSLRGVDALARWRGASAGMEAAEAFILLRALDR